MYWLVRCELAPDKREEDLDRFVADKMKPYWLSQPGIKDFHLYGEMLSEELRLPATPLFTGVDIYGDGLTYRRARTMMIMVDDLASLQHVLDSVTRKELRLELLTHCSKVENSLQHQIF